MWVRFPLWPQIMEIIMENWKDVIKENFHKQIDSHTAHIVGEYKKKNPVRVKIDDKYFFTGKGKTVWNDVGPAKNALRMHLLDHLGGCVNRGKRYGSPEYIDYKELHGYIEEIYQDFLKNRVTFEFLS